MARIHVTGAAGTGTTTLARALSGRLRVPWFDSDDYYWIPTIPPYRVKRDPAARDRRLAEDLATFDDWVWSGSAVGWKAGAEERLTLCVFLSLPDEVRLPRLRRREEEEHAGLPYVPREEIEAGMAEFLDWAQRYETGGLEVRSRRKHEEWLATLPCPVLRIEGDLSTEARVSRVMDALG